MPLERTIVGGSGSPLFLFMPTWFWRFVVILIHAFPVGLSSVVISYPPSFLKFMPIRLKLHLRSWLFLLWFSKNIKHQDQPYDTEEVGGACLCCVVWLILVNCERLEYGNCHSGREIVLIYDNLIVAGLAGDRHKSPGLNPSLQIGIMGIAQSVFVPKHHQAHR